MSMKQEPNICNTSRCKGNLLSGIFLSLILGVPVLCILLLWLFPFAPQTIQKSYPDFVQAWYQLPDDILRLPEPASTKLPTRKPVDTIGKLQSFGSSLKPTSNDDMPWPCFRGSDRTNKSDSSDLIHSFGPKGPPQLWDIDLGEGYAGPAVGFGNVYIMDYDQKARANALRCYSFETGKEIWQRSYPIDIRRQHGISRTVPAISTINVDTGKRDDEGNPIYKIRNIVVALGPKCTVVCCDANTGEHIWGMDLVAQYGTTVPRWYAGQCPLINANGHTIISPGGRSLMICINNENGKVLWEVPNPQGWKMSHTSILPLSLSPKAGGLIQNIYLYAAQGGIIGVRESPVESKVDGQDITTYQAKVAFLCPDWKVNTATVPTPVHMEEGKIFLCGGYGAGSAIMQIDVAEDGSGTAQIEKRFPPSVFGSEQHTPIYHDKHIYGVLSKEAGKNSCRMRCLNIDCEPVWTSGPNDTFGLGPYILAKDMIIAVDDNCVLTLAKLSSEGYQRLARAKIMEGHESWAPIAIADGRLLMRSLKKMVCLDLRKKE